MSVLAMPMVSQLTTITGDGRASQNAEFDCVPASIMACVLCLKGLKGWTNSYNPDRLLDMAYPQGYEGGTSIEQFVEAIKTFGCELIPQNGKPKDLIAFVHKSIRDGHPVCFTEPDPYLEGWTHVCVFYGESEGEGLIALDPYIARAVQKSDSGWGATILDNQIWVVEPIPGHVDPEPPEPSYTVKAGDNLWDIAHLHNMTLAELLSKNESMLDQVAREHGYRNSNGGSLIFPDTKILL